MARSFADYRPQNVAKWTKTLPVGSRIFDFYASQGDVTISSDTYVPTTLDGPIQVVKYGALTVNALHTAQYRCRGLIRLFESMTVGAAGKVLMTGRGARGNSGWPLYDLSIPVSIQLSASKISLREVLNYFRRTGYYIGDPVLWASPPPELADCTAIINPGVILLDHAGCGGATWPLAQIDTAGGPTPGPAGPAGSLGAPGGGGLGGVWGGASGWYGAPGRPWGSGPGAAGRYMNGYYPTIPDPWGGAGGTPYPDSGAVGGAGNPSGKNVPTSNGTGGVQINIGRSNINVNTGGLIASDGMPGEGTASGSCGAGSGGGHVSNIYGGALTNNGTIRSNGGLGGAPGNNNNYGGPGGAGCVVTKTWAQMGWA